MKLSFFSPLGRHAPADVVLSTSEHSAAPSLVRRSYLLFQRAASRAPVLLALSLALAPVALYGQMQGGITCSSSTAKANTQVPCSIYSNTPIATGVTVTLTSSSSAVSVPPSVFYPAGATSVNFTASVASPSTTQTVRLTAGAGGQSASFPLTLLPSQTAQAATGAALTLSSTSVAFGDVTLNTPATQSVTLTSSGTAPVVISGGSLTGAGFSIQGPTAPLTLNPGQSATAEIQFDPTTAGAATGQVSITSNASPATITLSGTGQSAAYDVQLNWNAPSSTSDSIAGYEVYREAAGGSYAALNTSPDAATSYTDSGVQSGTTYNYYVVSVDSAGNQSGASNNFTVTVP